MSSKSSDSRPLSRQHSEAFKSPQYREAEQLFNQSRTLSQRVATYNQRVVGENDALAEEVKQLQKTIEKALDEARDAPADAMEDEVIGELKHARAVVHGHGPGGDMRKLIKSRNPKLLTLLVGANTRVVTMQRNESIRLKEEYHAFRDRSAMCLVVFAVALITGLELSLNRMAAGAPLSLTPPMMVVVQLFLCWLLYWYTAMALRENVLKVNGSNIRSWWIEHHYWSIATCMLLLTLPVDSPAVQRCVRKMAYWSCLQGVFMILQNRYQRRRMYTRIALGKNAAMDVVSGESSGAYGQMFILYPMLFALQAFQLFIGVEMASVTFPSLLNSEGWLDLESHESDLRGSRGVCLAGLMMLYMGLSNFRNTIATLLEKRSQRRTRARSRSYPTLDKAAESSAERKSARKPSPAPATKAE